MLLLMRRAVARPPRFARAQSSVIASPHVEWRSAADLRAPEEWYPKARLSRRRVIYHGGPTNSGKTYHALEALKRADADGGGGVYAGPLRLLALEVYERLNAAGCYCSLFTGQERREVPFATHASCTIEMVPVGRRWDVAVVDEIQMIGSPDRGHAWTRALHGLDAREIHVCGALDAAALVERLCGITGDAFELKEYERLTPLTTERAHLDGWKGVKKGDCVVTFSRDDIHRVRREIETANEDMKCCVVYGQLPPETRAQQARLFNDEASGYDVLVASDAVGMGLNLNIGRVLFRQILKYSGELSDEDLDGVDEAYREDSRKTRLSPVEHQLVKQIAGRAGRMATAFSSGGGGVTAMDARDLSYVRAALAAPNDAVSRAGLFPPAEILALFAAELGDADMGLGDVVAAFVEACEIDESLYYVCGQDEVAKVVKKLDDDIRLDLADMLLFCTAPCNLNDRFAVSMLNAYARARAGGGRCGPNVRLPKGRPSKLSDLHDLCSKHNVLDLYLWLAFRFPETFPDSAAATAQKQRCIALIAATLESRTLELPAKKGAADAEKKTTAKKKGPARKRAPTSAKRRRPGRAKPKR